MAKRTKRGTFARSGGKKSRKRKSSKRSAAAKRRPRYKSGPMKGKFKPSRKRSGGKRKKKGGKRRATSSARRRIPKHKRFPKAQARALRIERKLAKARAHRAPVVVVQSSADTPFLRRMREQMKHRRQVHALPLP